MSEPGPRWLTPRLEKDLERPLEGGAAADMHQSLTDALASVTNFEQAPTGEPLLPMAQVCYAGRSRDRKERQHDLLLAMDLCPRHGDNDVEKLGAILVPIRGGGPENIISPAVIEGHGDKQRASRRAPSDEEALMRRITFVSLAISFSFVVTPAAAAANTEHQGKKVFDDGKCGQCHSVSSAGIESKVKIKKLKGPDLTGIGERYEADWIGKYLKKEINKKGKAHKKPFKGSDEELQALVDWLLEQKAE